MSENAQPAGETSESRIPPEGEQHFRPQPVPTRAQLEARRQFRRALRRAKNPLFIPIRWLFVTFVIVVFILLGALAIVVSLRGETPTPAQDSAIHIVTADVVQVPIADIQQATSVPNHADAAPQVILAPETPASLILTGPAVPTVIVTDTPVPLAVGLKAAVHNVGNDELNVRNVPSVRDSEVLFRAPAGTLFNIIGGPQQADGYSWWQLHDPQFEVIGWAVANYLQSAPETTGQDS